MKFCICAIDVDSCPEATSSLLFRFLRQALSFSSFVVPCRSTSSINDSSTTVILSSRDTSCPC